MQVANMPVSVLGRCIRSQVLTVVNALLGQTFVSSITDGSLPTCFHRDIMCYTYTASGTKGCVTFGSSV